jgi:hypothetical protein
MDEPFYLVFCPGYGLAFTGTLAYSFSTHNYVYTIHGYEEEYGVNTLFTFAHVHVIFF